MSETSQEKLPETTSMSSQEPFDTIARNMPSTNRSPHELDISKQVVTVHVGSRESKLALIQTKHVIKCLQDVHNRQDSNVHYEFRVETMKTIGDKILEQPLPEIGDKGLFTQELEEALLDKRVDFIVHSLKDLPTTLPEKCCVGAILQ